MMNMKKYIGQGMLIVIMTVCLSMFMDMGSSFVYAQGSASDPLCITRADGGSMTCFPRSEVDSAMAEGGDPVCITASECYVRSDIQTAIRESDSGTATPSASPSSTSTPTAAPTSDTSRGGGQSGPVGTPPFRNVDPNSSFIGPFTGPDTAPLQGAYTAPLLQVADRQIAFQILVNFFLGVIGVVAVLYLVTNGYRYVMARGDEGQMTAAKKGITFAIVGLLFVLAAYTIVATILNFGARPPVTSGVSVGIGVSF